jgi:hypothetical protein
MRTARVFLLPIARPIRKHVLEDRWSPPTAGNFITTLRTFCMSRVLAAALFTVVIFIVSDCSAQRPRGFLIRGGQIPAARHSQRPRFENFERSEAPARYHQGGRFQLYDPRTEPQDDAWDRYPKYIGGFHASEYYNLGVPHGDIGFRGNGIYWAPWQ